MTRDNLFDMKMSGKKKKDPLTIDRDTVKTAIKGAVTLAIVLPLVSLLGGSK